MACNCLPPLTFPAGAPTGVLMRDLASGNEVDCPICADPLTADSTAHPWTGPAPFLVEGCANGHVYHKGCLLTWIARATSPQDAGCPDCRAPLLPAVVQSLQSQGTPTPAPAPSEAEQEAEGEMDPRGQELMERMSAITNDRSLTPFQRNQALFELRRSLVRGHRGPSITPAAVARLRQLRRQDEQLRQRRQQREAHRARQQFGQGSVVVYREIERRYGSLSAQQPQ